MPGLTLASDKTIKVGIYQNKPKVFIDSAGEPQGFFIDILNHIASKEGWQLDYVASTWQKNLEKLETAEIDLLLDVAESEGRTELFDFNNSLQAISSYVELMKYEKARDSQDSNYLGKILNIIKNANHLTKQLLAVNRKIKSKLNPINLNDQILQVQTLLARTIPKMIKIELDLGPDLKIIDADSGQIEQILLNLALNASHAMSAEGKISIKTKNVVLDRDFINMHWGTDPGAYVLLEVADTGYGIAKEIRHRIYEPFFTTKDPEQGTGLGLSMVYGIIKNHHGHIECDSEPGAGTRFSIYFPVSKFDDALQDEIATKKENLAPGHETILRQVLDKHP